MATFLQFVQVDAKLPYLNELKRLCRKKGVRGGKAKFTLRNGLPGLQ